MCFFFVTRNLGFASSYIVGVGWIEFSNFFSFFLKLDLKYTPKFMNALYTFLFVKSLKWINQYKYLMSKKYIFLRAGLAKKGYTWRIVSRKVVNIRLFIAPIIPSSADWPLFSSIVLQIFSVHFLVSCIIADRFILYLRWSATPSVTAVINRMIALMLRTFKKFSTTNFLRCCLEEILWEWYFLNPRRLNDECSLKCTVA